jgi:hypothetical protein
MNQKLLLPSAKQTRRRKRAKTARLHSDEQPQPQPRSARNETHTIHAAEADEPAKPQYKGKETLAATLLEHLGMDPAEIDRISRANPANALQLRRRLTTPRQVVRAIAQVVGRIDREEIDPKQARVLLYGLQTLIVAMRIRDESDARELARELPEMIPTAQLTPGNPEEP